MKLNVSKYLEIINERGITGEQIQRATGLSEMSYQWILDRQFIEIDTLERMADAIGCKVGEIFLPDSMNSSENVIEWIRDSDRATLSLTQQRIVTKVKKLAVSRPEECQIVADNKDGSICARVPVSWIKINPSMQLTDEQREERAKAMRRNILENDNLCSE